MSLDQDILALQQNFAMRTNSLPSHGVLGDVNGTITDPLLPLTNVYVRVPTSNGLSAPLSVILPASANVQLLPGWPVLIGYNHNLQPIVLGTDTQTAAATGVASTTTVANANSVSTTQAMFETLALVSAGGMIVNLKGWNPIISDVYTEFSNGGIDLTSFVPSAGEMCYATIFILADLSGVEVVASTPVLTSDLPLSAVDVNECIAGKTAGSTPTWAIMLTGGLTSINQYYLDSPTNVKDLRQMVNTASSGGTSTLDVTDGITTVTGVTEIDFTSGATVTDAGGGVAEVAITGGSGNSTYTSVYASRPSPSTDGDLFYPSDGFTTQRDTSAAWVPWGPLFPFTEPPTSSWTWDNQGTATVTSAKGGLTFHETNAHGGGFQARVYYRTAPSAPYTITIAYLPVFADVGDGAEAGLCFRQSSDGKLASFSRSSVSTFTWEALKWTTSSSFSGSYATSSKAMLQFGGIVWLRIADNNTNRICSFSSDGINFVPFHTVGRTDFLTADQIGIYLIGYQTGAEVYSNVLSYVVG